MATRAASKPSKKSTKSSSLVPVLFTLGVIGWGFFAIDRLTSNATPEYQLQSVEARDITSNNLDSAPAWKKSAENFLGRFRNNQTELVADNHEFDDWSAVSEDEEAAPRKQTAARTETETVTESASARYALYFYADSEADMQLQRVEFKESQKLTPALIFSRLINGPQGKENRGKYLDSFPVKPSVLDAKIEESVLILDLDDNFGHGISFETAELQLKQLAKTATQFKNARFLQININSREVETISVDGLSLPTRIKLN